MDLSVKFFLEKIKRGARPKPDDSPSFYIADLNTSNEVYTYFRKAQAIRENLSNLENLTPIEIITRLNKSQNAVLLKESDIAIVEEVKKKHEALKMIKALYFEANKKPLLEIGGAGGRQYLSEAIAAQDDNLLEKIDKRQNGALIGIFAMGGGTGSGSLFSILSRYCLETGRYTVGLGVLPTRKNPDEYANAGRYLTKYVSANQHDRFHTLFLFSNEEASRVIVEDTAQLKDTTELQIINEYISAFIHDFSSINDSKTTTLRGKLFDPMDGITYLRGISSIGYSTAEDFSPEKLFVKAISPMSFEDGALSGLTVRITRERFTRDQRQNINRLIEKIVHTFVTKDIGDEEISELSYDRLDQPTENELINSFKNDLKELHKLTPFYRTTKQIRIFYFIKDKSYEGPTLEFIESIEKFLNVVTGSYVQVSINVYYARQLEVQTNSILVIFGGGFSFDVYESIVRYAQSSFIRGNEEAMKFMKELLEQLLSVGNKVASDVVMKDLEKDIGNLLSDDVCRPVEDIEKKGGTALLHNPDLKQILSDERLDQILVKKDDLVASLAEVVYNFSLGDKEIVIPPPDLVFGDK